MVTFRNPRQPGRPLFTGSVVFATVTTATAGNAIASFIAKSIVDSVYTNIPTHYATIFARFVFELQETFPVQSKFYPLSSGIVLVVSVTLFEFPRGDISLHPFRYSMTHERRNLYKMDLPIGEGHLTFGKVTDPAAGDAIVDVVMPRIVFPVDTDSVYSCATIFTGLLPERGEFLKTQMELKTPSLGISFVGLVSMTHGMLCFFEILSLVCFAIY
jgi:hypothetical protein